MTPGNNPLMEKPCCPVSCRSCEPRQPPTPGELAIFILVPIAWIGILILYGRLMQRRRK